MTNAQPNYLQIRKSHKNNKSWIHLHKQIITIRIRQFKNNYYYSNSRQKVLSNKEHKSQNIYMVWKMKCKKRNTHRKKAEKNILAIQITPIKINIRSGSQFQNCCLIAVSQTKMNWEVFSLWSTMYIFNPFKNVYRFQICWIVL